MILKPDPSPQTNRCRRFGFGRRLSCFFGRWIGCQRPFPAAGGDEFVLATCEAAAVDYAKIDAHDYFNRHCGNSALCFRVLEPCPPSTDGERIPGPLCNVPMTAEGMVSIIDDRNRREGRKDTSNYAQAHLAMVTAAAIHLQMLQALDRGDTNMAKRMLLSTLNVDTGFLPECQKRGKISEKQLEEASVFARNYLDYLVAHTNVIVVPRVDFNMALYGLADLLKDRADLERLNKLLESLNWPASKPSTKGGGQSGPANGTQPGRPETNGVSTTAPASGSP